MINLIPNTEKKRMARDFYYRLIVISFLAFGFAIWIGAVVMVPSYVLSKVKVSLADEKLALEKSEPVPAPDQETLNAIKALSQKLSIVEGAEKNKFNVTEKIINAIILDKMPDIHIYEISYDNAAGGKKVSIKGIAPSRERLLLFRLALEDDSAFKSVDLPISNFVKGSNIQFSISLIPS
jgi:hypothetical protein